MTITAERPVDAAPPPPLPRNDDRKAPGEQVGLTAFVVLPFLAVIGAVPLLWGHGISLLDVILAVSFYAIAGHGITVGFHRYFTHGSFKAIRPVRIALGVMGSLAIQGSVIRWVADHRRHHAFSDTEGDPHSPHRFGRGTLNMLHGLWYAHLGWLFDPQQSSKNKYAPDLLADPDIVAVDRAFGPLVAVSLLLPALLGGLISWSWTGALTAFFWAGLVRVFLLHHTTWSINSLCHMFGKRPFKTRDMSTNFWPLAVLSMGECWHNLHHADPTLARHGVRRFELDSSARLIGLMEACHLVSDVRWPNAERLAKAVA